MTTRRSALLTLTATIAALLGKQLDAQGKFITSSTWKMPEPTSLSFDLAGFKEYKISLNGKPVVTLTPEQMADALREK